MNDLRQQQVQVQVAATSSSVNLAATPLCSNSSSSSSNSSSASVSPRSSSNSNSNSSIGSSCKATISTTTRSNQQQGQEQEEEQQQVVSSTSSQQQQEPQEQQLNVSPAAAAQRQQQQQQQQQHLQQLVGQITSTTASPPQHRLRDDAQLPNSSSNNNSNTTAAAATSTTAAATTSEAAMAATALDVNGEDNNSDSSSSNGVASSNNSSSHKIILKLSKHGSNTSAESLGGNNDERRVEPLRIQLPQQLPTTTTTVQGQQVPKITIRPLKPQDSAAAAVSSDACSSGSSSSCADEEPEAESERETEQLPHIVPKLTIRAANEERDNSVVPKLIIKMPDTGGGAAAASESSNCNSPLKSGAGGTAGALPKLTIKTTKLDGQGGSELISCSLSPASASSSCASSSSSSGSEQSTAAMPTVPKLMIKTTHAGSSCISEQQQPQHQQIPKLTIKTTPTATTSTTTTEQLQQQHTVIMSHDAKNAQCIPKLTIKTKSIEMEDEQHEQQQLVPKLTIKTSNCSEQQQPLLKLTIKNLCSPKHKVRAVLEEKVSTSKLTLTNGGESNSQPATTVTVDCETDELRRNSDDMDIDDALSKEHDPKMFHNLPPTTAAVAAAVNGLESKQQQQQQPARQKHNIVEMVDLTSSPSPGSSPVHTNSSNNYTPVAPSTTAANRSLSPADSRNLLIECFRLQLPNPASPNSNILLSQLTAPPKSFNNNNTSNNSNNSTVASKYPQLTERLMANGSGKEATGTVAATATAAATATVAASQPQPIIDSIEILDTPEGSPQLTPYMQSAYEPETPPPLNNHLNYMHLNLNQNLNHKPPDNHQQQQLQLNNNENHLKRQQQQLQQHQQSEPNAESPSGLPPSKQRRLDNNENDQQTHNCSSETTTTVAGIAAAAPAQPQQQQSTHRSRKQKHERILNTELEEPQIPQQQHQQQLQLQPLSNGTVLLDKERLAAAAAVVCGLLAQDANANPATALTPATTTAKRRGRPKRNANESTPATVAAAAALLDATGESAVKSRRVQLLRKRLAIDMVSAEQPADELRTMATQAEDNHIDETAKQPVVTAITPRRATRRNTTATMPAAPTAATPAKGARKRQSKAAAAAATAAATAAASVLMPHFGVVADDTETETNNNSNSNNNSLAYALAAQIDLTMCSSSSSTSNGSAITTTATATSAGAGTATGATPAAATMGGSSCSMLPPTSILSSSDPLPDVIFQPNDFSSIMATQQLRSPRTNNNNGNSNSCSLSGGSQHDSQDEDNYSMLDHSGDESSAQGNILGAFGGATAPTTPTRGRGRGRGSRGGGAGSSARSSSGSSRINPNAAQPRVPRMSRGASAVAKAIALSRPRCVGGLKHQPDPERLKGLFSPSPQVFEEDTRMSADLNNSNQSVTSMEPPLTPQKQLDFLNNEESQSSMVSSVSLMDSNQGQSVDTIIGSALKRPKKKKMEICVAEDTEFKASSIAEYDWPPPKGCCPSKNRDTFMIQEQIALYLGITSFKRKYPDLPRRAVDMEERNWLQEKGLVSEKMCDLGITAVWASDVLDIMYADFFDKYEEYKEFLRQKHLRDIEAKQKALGLTVSNGRGLQARDRAMLSTSKWNVYFNKTRKEERLACLDLQTFTMNLPVSRSAPSSTLLYRSIANVVRSAAQAENMPAPPNLLPPRFYDSAYQNPDYAYPLGLVPGQFTSNYRHLTPAELRAYPLNTVLEKLDTLQQQEEEQPQQPQSVKEELTKPQTLTAAVRRSLRARHHKLRGSSDAVKKQATNSVSYDSSVSGSSDASSSESDSDGESDSSCSSSTSSSSSRSSFSGHSSSSFNSASETEQKREQDKVAARLSSNCGVCQRSQHRNARNMPEAFIRCYSCRRRVHPSCIEMPQRMVSRVRNYNWQCADCKCCIKCRSSQRPGKMLYCEQCDRGYHIYCLGVKTVPDGRWSCERCAICMRCGATRPEGLPAQMQPTSASTSPSGGVDSSKGVKPPVKHKKVKWMNEYRIDHITNLREHCSMLCVPCARAKPNKRTQQQQATTTPTVSATTIPETTPTSAGAADTCIFPACDAAAASQAGTPTPVPVTVQDATTTIIAALSPSGSNNLAPPLASEATVVGNKKQQQMVTTMQCSSFNRNSNDDATTAAEAAAAAAAVATAATVAATPVASSSNNNSTTTTAATTIGIAPPPVVA